MKKQKTLFIIMLVLIIVGCICPLYEIDHISEGCNVISILAFIFNSVIAFYVYTRTTKYKNLIIIPEIISLIFFILIWSDISDKFTLMYQRGISYKYCIGFYFLLIGTFGSILLYIISIREKKVKGKKKYKYITNKVTGSIQKKEI